MESVRNLSDSELLKRLVALNSDEVRVVARVLVYLLEVEKRKLYLGAGHASLFSYCVSVLNYCESTAARRVAAARCINNFPRLLALFLEQKITLTTIVIISKIMTKENQEEVIAAVSNKGKFEVEKYVAGYLPQRSIHERIRALPSFAPLTEPFFNRSTEVPGSEKPTTETAEKIAGKVSGEMEEIKVPAPIFGSPKLVPSWNEPHRAAEEDKGDDRRKDRSEVNFEIKLQARDSAVKKLRRVQQLRGKRESLGDLLELLLDEYLERHSPEARIVRREQRKERKLENQNKFAKRENSAVEGLKPTTAQVKRTRYISQRVRDKLHREYDGRCAYVAPDGTRCGCRTRLEVDHVFPFGLGGTNEVGNLRLLCAAHNRFAAERIYGKEKMVTFSG